MRIDLMAVRQTAELLRDESRNLGKIAESLERELAEVRKLRSLEDLVPVISRQRTAILERRISLEQMIRALEKICEITQRCEMRVLDEVEKERIVFRRLEVQNIEVRLPKVADDPLKITW